MYAEEAMEHFARLLEISDTAIQEGQTTELHYIELAMTETLNQIEQALGPEAAARESVAARIDSLRGLALRLHDAGHDGSVPLAANVQQAMRNAFAELKAELEMRNEP